MTKIRWGAAALAAVAIGSSAFAATIQFNSRSYDRSEAGWVLQDAAGSFPVDATTISVRFVDGIAGIDGFRRAWLSRGGDAELAQGCETLVRDAVNDALGAVEDGAEAALAGGLAGRRFRDALASHKATGVGAARRPPAAVSKRDVDQRADAFRRMTGVRR